MNTSARRRLMRDFKRLKEDPPYGCTASPQNQNIMIWDCYIFGPEETVWEGAAFKLQMTFTEDYPNAPPKVIFLSKVFHPNVYVDGRICLDILDKNWTSIYDVSSILTSLQSLLTDPNGASPANAAAADLYRSNRDEYDKKVKECVEQSLLAFAEENVDEDDDDDDEAGE